MYYVYVIIYSITIVYIGIKVKLNKLREQQGRKRFCNVDGCIRRDKRQSFKRQDDCYYAIHTMPFSYACSSEFLTFL